MYIYLYLYNYIYIYYKYINIIYIYINTMLDNHLHNSEIILLGFKMRRCYDMTNIPWLLFQPCDRVTPKSRPSSSPGALRRRHGEPGELYFFGISVCIYRYGYGSILINTIFRGMFTSINPSYFDVNYRGTRF